MSSLAAVLIITLLLAALAWLLHWLLIRTEGIFLGRRQLDAWNARPAWERKLMGFFNISSWINFGWVGVGLIGQGAFFGRAIRRSSSC